MPPQTRPNQSQKLLIANRGEIAVRIIRTAQRLQVPTVAIYALCDATALHVTLADESALLRPNDVDPASNARGYVDIEEIVRVCVKHGVTLVHPGYGFLSENPDFAQALQEKGIAWVGPRPDVIRRMGLKHEARGIAERAGVPVVPGSEGNVLGDADEAAKIASAVGYPVLLKATAGGGGMGMTVFTNEADLRAGFTSAKDRAMSLFDNPGLFVERYVGSARHVEVQVFGDGRGRVIHMGERECSIQRRHQKVIEEAPSPFMMRHPDVRNKLCQAAVDLCVFIDYNSAGTVEFLVDDSTGEFFFLEMNTRIQVEHTVTEALCPSLDIVELMLHEATSDRSTSSHSLLSDKLDWVQHHFASPVTNTWAFQARIYCENPSANFKPCPGVLQHVRFPSPMPRWLRIDTWIQTGTTVTPFYDPLVAKVVSVGKTRGEALARTLDALRECEIWGPPNNVAYLQAVCASETFRVGRATTRFLSGFDYTPRALDILHGGVETTIQDFPGRQLTMGIPRSGPMDSLALRIANIVVGSPEGTEGLEIALPAAGCRMLFHVDTVICVTGANARVTIDGGEVPMWSRVIVPGKSKLAIGKREDGVDAGFRTYVAVRGGFPEVAQYLGSKSTSMGLGGYQGRSLVTGDQLSLGRCSPTPADHTLSLPPSIIPSYPSHEWTIYCLSGPHSDDSFITPSGLTTFFSTAWRVSGSSNRMGIRLEGPKIEWARENGGEGGSHPSNVHDNGYALGSVNVNGDTPVILGPEGPDMGGYMCVCTVASADMWKLGQLRPGDNVRFRCISFDSARRLATDVDNHLGAVKAFVAGSADDNFTNELSLAEQEIQELAEPQNPKLKVLRSPEKPLVVFRQAGDAAILVEYGEPLLDVHLRARVHAFEDAVRTLEVPGVWALSPCNRSTMVRFDPTITSQSSLLSALIAAEYALPTSTHDLTFSGRKITFPIVLDDPWTRGALERYMKTVRDEAVYLPSNVEYLARNNDPEGGVGEALRVLVQSDWLVFGVGFYLGCPFLVPIDPRCRLVGQKMNPSRTYTPRGAVGIAGLVAAIYPIESPGGYQLFGRTLPPWQTWGKGEDFSPDTPWLLDPFDQVSFKAVTEAEYVEMERQFDAGQYKFEIEPVTFSMADYDAFVASIQPEVDEFRRRQAKGVASQEAREHELLSLWEKRKRDERESRLATASGELSNTEPTGSTSHVTSSVNASVWKIPLRSGYIIQKPEDVLIVLEAMKTEINVEAGEENVGRTVKGYGSGVKEGALVSPGQVLVYLE